MFRRESRKRKKKDKNESESKLSPVNWRMLSGIYKVKNVVSGKNKGLFGHMTHMLFGHMKLMAWKEDRTRGRDLEIMSIKEIVWAIGIEAIEKGESRKRGLVVSPANWERNGFQNARRKLGQWFIWDKGKRTIATSCFHMSVLNMLLLNKIK